MEQVYRVDTLKTFLEAQDLVQKRKYKFRKYVRSTFADSMGERFQTLADGYNEGEWDRRAVDPISVEVLGLKTSVRGHLEEV